MTPEQIQKITVSQLKKTLKNTSSVSEETLLNLENDTRSGIRNLATQFRSKQKAIAQEKARLEQMCMLENKLRERGLTHIAGVDEAGRGPLAGPVVASAVILPAHTLIDGLNDSKKLTEQKRETLFEHIQNMATSIGIGQATPQEIDKLNIRNATHLAMRRALEQLDPAPNRVLIDGNATPESSYSEMAIIGGDRKSLSIAAASIIAKVTRDRLMVQYDQDYPEYGFAKHKGYGSADHLAALQKHGPTPIHRTSFAGVPQNYSNFSDDFDVFLDGILAANTPEQLSAIGESIKLASPDLLEAEVTTLREKYRAQQARLQRTGNQGERLAVQYLEKNGFKILKKNFRAAGGEIDIIATRDNTLSFIEVKTATQTQFGDPKTWVTPQKQQQIIHVAQAYLQFASTPHFAPRFDVIAIDLSSPQPQIEHIEGAFSKSP